MSKIDISGVYFAQSGHPVLVTQGLSACTLVAGKKFLFRLYLNVAPTSCITVIAHVTYRMPGFRLTKTLVIPSGSLLFDEAGPLGSSVGVVLAGDAFPLPSLGLSYTVAFDVLGAGTSVLRFELEEMTLLAPGRLRLLIHNLVGTAPWGTKIESDLTWLIEIFRGLERLGAMMPVRDGIKLGLGHADAGICFLFGEPLDPWPAVCPAGGAPPCDPGEMFERNMRETREINADGTLGRVDATVLWRPRDRTFPPPNGEGMGGKAISYNSPPGTGLVGMVGGESRGLNFTGAILAQELGHLFGLEPRESPHFEDPMYPLHSKHPMLNDAFAFDFCRLTHYRPTGSAYLGDVMSGGGVWQGSDMSLFNAFDWEYLRQRLVKIPRSTARRAAKVSRDELVAALEPAFPRREAIKVTNPERTLSAAPGVTWQWTARGLEPVVDDVPKKRGRVLGATAEALRSSLHDQDVSEFHAPVGNRPQPAIVSPNATPVLQRENVGGMYWLQDL
jgi:hypothetical protein